MKKFLCLVLCSVLLWSISSECFAAGEKETNTPEKSVPETVESLRVQSEIKASSAVLAEVNTGKILFEYNADEKRSPASITKIMTILLVCEALDSGKISLGDSVTCSKNASSKGGSQIWLKEGETMTVDELLKATVIGSANDAATLLGEFVAGSEEAFVSLMNERAVQLGMKNTFFENATGLDDTADKHLSTARDIAVMSCELLKHEIITNYSTVWMDSLRNGKTELVNTNKLVRFYNGTTGLKTGTTSKAGCCISASAERDGLHLVAVVLGSNNSNDRFETAKMLLNLGFSEYALFKPQIDESLITEIKVLRGEYSSIVPEIPQIEPILVKKGEESSAIQKAELPLDIQAPVIKGQTVGKISFISNGKTLAEYPLKVGKEINSLSFKTVLYRLLKFTADGVIEEY